MVRITAIDNTGRPVTALVRTTQEMLLLIDEWAGDIDYVFDENSLVVIYDINDRTLGRTSFGAIWSGEVEVG